MVLLQSVRITGNFDSQSINVKFDYETGVLYVKWSEDVSFDQFKKGYGIALDYARVFQANKWLIDLSECSILPEEYQKWVNNVFFPLIFRSNKCDCFIAGIFPVSYYNFVQDWYDSSKLINENYLLLFNPFLVPEAGLRWLSSVS